MPLLLLFVIVPVVEMWVLIQVGSKIGALTTIALVLLTAMIGLALLRKQGVSTLARANQRMQAGEMPAKEMVEGLFLAVGGALLLTPGFVTDLIGFSCLIPGLRSLVIGRLMKHVVMRASAGGASFGAGSAGGSFGGGQAPYRDRPFRRGRHGDDFIEGEYERQDSPQQSTLEPGTPDQDSSEKGDR
ncbi:FxsA family protein [Aestuariicella hydrocarbonica]|uniref:FxsA family protein n=1 Tax=Pseudomaricurvus hydrocarbonicus TaxID=1470433 RepID=A0A9E5MLP6_9GAMM|nr:FxsA family protein [Aestuariicella hydrocarbonica]NHO65123.1 FxsA family protein [Aestuariicella hydrocarbonica]